MQVVERTESRNKLAEMTLPGCDLCRGTKPEPVAAVGGRGGKSEQTKTNEPNELFIWTCDEEVKRAYLFKNYI